MNIAVDIRPLMGGRISGVETYIRHLLEHLFAIDSKNTYILFANASKDQRRFLNFFDLDGSFLNNKNVVIIQTKIPNKILNIALSFFGRPKLDTLILNYFKKHPETRPKTMIENRVDLFFMPDLRLSALSPHVKKVLTVHDLSFEHYPRFFSWKTRLWYKLLQPRKEIERSDTIIAVSHFTKQDLLNTYHVSSEKIQVVWEGVAENFCKNIAPKEIEAVREKYHLPDQYLLFLSTLEPRKNIKKLCEAFRLFKNKYPDNSLKLVLAGVHNPKIFSSVEFQKSNDILFPGFIDEVDKAALIKGAQAFVYPSLFEGFGLPVLEALQCGIPVITSNTSSLPEIIGEAGILIDPLSTSALLEAIERVQDTDFCRQLQLKAKHQAQKFDWKKCAEVTLASFENCCRET